jgi:hypothetical protein
MKYTFKKLIKDIELFIQPFKDENNTMFIATIFILIMFVITIFSMAIIYIFNIN